MPNDPFEEEHRRFRDAVRRHHEAMEAARRHLMDTMRRGQKDIEETGRALQERLAAAGRPPRARPGPPAERPGGGNAEAVFRHAYGRRNAQHTIDEAIQKALRGAPRNRPNPKDRKRRHDGEPDIGGVPVEPNNPRNLSGGAAAVPEAEE